MSVTSADSIPTDTLELLKAYLSSQPRGVRIFDGTLTVLWDNTPDRAEAYGIFRGDDGAVLPIPPDGVARRVWPVHLVLSGAPEAERLYKLEPPHADTSQCYRVKAWPLSHSGTPGGATGADGGTNGGSNGGGNGGGARGHAGQTTLIVEETERLAAKDCQDHRIGQLDKEVETLLAGIVDHLERGRAGDVLRLRLANPHVRKCREVRHCGSGRCPAFQRHDNLRCWEIPGTFCPEQAESKDILTKFRYCHECEVFIAACPDPLTRVAENFNRLIALLQLKYHEALEMQRQLQQSEKLGVLGELLAGIAHEIKNPLGIIMGRLDVLSLELEGQTHDEVAEDFEVIRSQASRVKTIIDHLLKMARPGPLETKTVAINDVISDTLPMVQKTLQHSNVRLEPRLTPNLPSIDVDVIHVQQVLLNLIINARDAMPTGGTLTITSEVDDPHAPQGVTIHVRDTGVGMTPDQLKVFFSPFYTTKLEQGGTGLGLAVCQRIMRQHKGRIDAESHPNEGTLMRLWFPIKGATG